MIRDAIIKLASGHSLSQSEASEAMREIMSGQATPAQIASFLTALRLKGETVDEISGLALVMRENVIPVETTYPVVDTCGTGGAESDTINISTAAAIVVAAAGVPVAKHGNRAMSSQTGSADVLEALGVRVDLGPIAAKRCLDEVGIAFLFAQIYHPAMRHAALPRREIGFRTVFNILGPLTNPARARHQVIGTGNAALVPKLAEVLVRLGTSRSLVVCGVDGTDEMSISSPTDIIEIQNGATRAYQVTPEDVGLRTADAAAIVGGPPAVNATAVKAVFAGETGARRDVVVLNAAAALYAFGSVDSLRNGVERAARAIDDGSATRRLADLAKLSQELGE